MNSNNSRDIVIIQMTDSHIFANQQEQFGEINSFESLRKVVSTVKQAEETIDAVIFTGDLVNEPDIVAYENLQNCISILDKPIYCLPGNHDSLQMMEALFNSAKITCPGHIKIADWELVLLNSMVPGTHAGHLEQSELERLEQHLQTMQGKHALICLHHHPVSIDSPWMDSMMLDNGKALFSVLDQFDQVKGVIWGHIHQAFTQIRNNVHLMGTPSTCAQFQPGAKSYGRDESEMNSQPGYRRLILKPTGEIETKIIRVKL